MVPLAVVISKLSGAPIWLQLHGVEAWRRRTGVFRWCVEQVNFVTAVSRHTRRQFLSWANLDPNRVFVLPNTVGKNFTPEGNRLTAKETYGLAGKRVLLTVSRLVKSERYKGHERVLRCLPQIAEEIDDLVYVIAGDGDMRCELEELVHRERLEDVVVFTGEVEKSELPTLYRAADVFVMPSSGEGFGIVYLEALACGTPVIAGDSDGARDPLQDGNLGVLADEQGLTAELRCLLGLSPRCGRFRGSSREIGDSVKRYFGREVFNTLVRDATEKFERAARTDIRAGS
jgi:phosphatidylinositol alpha-1,6-mannosyltransferase